MSRGEVESAAALLQSAFAAYASGQVESGRDLLEKALDREPLLKDTAALITPLRNYAAGLLTDARRSPAEANRFMETLFANLPAAAAALTPFANSELAWLSVDVAFRAYALGQMAVVRRAVRQALRRNPGWLLNRGVLSIWLEALLGQRVAATFRDARPRGLVRRVTLWRRQTQIDLYLRSHPRRKLHVGCGGFLLPDWLNTDLSLLNRGGVAHVDAAEALPVGDATFDFVYSEHFIEHLSYAEGCFFLAECRRVLKPGGVCRLATPRLELLMNLYGDRDGRYEPYTRWSFERWVGGDLYSRALVVNNFFYNWGHRCIYDAETLAAMLRGAGFSRIEACQVGESAHLELRGLERHATVTTPEFNRLETMVWEAQK